MTQTHCQICARPIKVRDGRIVQHGYQVPWGTVGDHSRTASCLGYGYVPYEAGRDRMKEVIAIYEEMLGRVRQQLDELLASPPERLSRKRRDYHGRIVEDVSDRPEGFSAKKLGPITPRSYVNLFVARRNELRQSANMLAIEIGDLEERYKAWKAPAA